MEPEYGVTELKVRCIVFTVYIQFITFLQKKIVAGFTFYGTLKVPSRILGVK